MAAVVVSVITREHIFAGTAKWLLRCGLPVQITHTYAPIVQNRNLQVKKFLDSDYSFIFFLDSDTVPKEGTVERLLEEARADRARGRRAIHCAPSWAYHAGWKPFRSAYKTGSKQGVYTPVQETTGIVEVDACGMSGTLVHQSFFTRLSILGPWFRAYTDPDHLWHSEDFNFFQAAKQMDYTIFAHLDWVAEHHKPVSLGPLVDLDD